jgi:excinuclease UvrABC ATPase subunit
MSAPQPLVRESWEGNVFSAHECPGCDGTGITEKRVYGRNAELPTVEVACPVCAGGDR